MQTESRGSVTFKGLFGCSVFAGTSNLKKHTSMNLEADSLIKLQWAHNKQYKQVKGWSKYSA